MKGTVKYILFGGLALAAVAALANSFAGGLVYSFKRIKWLGFEGIRPRFAILLDFRNNNDVSASVTSMRGQLLYGDYRITDVNIEKGIIVQPASSAELEVEFSVSPAVLTAEILRFVEQRSGAKRFRMRGTITGRAGDVPFVFPFNQVLQLAE